jgi:hypothetical protein
MRPLGFVAAPTGEEPVGPAERELFELLVALRAVVLDVRPRHMRHPRFTVRTLFAENPLESFCVRSDLGADLVPILGDRLDLLGRSESVILGKPSAATSVETGRL